MPNQAGRIAPLGLGQGYEVQWCEFHGHSAKRFSQALHIDLQTLAEQAHVHRNTLSRAPSSQGVQRFFRDALKVIKSAVFELRQNL